MRARPSLTQEVRPVLESSTPRAVPRRTQRRRKAVPTGRKDSREQSVILQQGGWGRVGLERSGRPLCKVYDCLTTVLCT